MGSINEESTTSQRKDVTVLVTGFGPFQDRYPVNPSYEITRSLPSILPNTTADGRRVRVLAYATPIRVCYEDVRILIPALHERLCDVVDLVLHIGMTSGRQYYTAEMYGHRDGYTRSKDLDGVLVPANDGATRFGDCPVIMTTALNCEHVLRKWVANVLELPEGSPALGADCRLSDDAGHYLCDYIYFNSLAWFGRRSGKLDGGKSSDRPVLFLHVPAESDPETLERGREVTVALIQAMADDWCASERVVRTGGLRDGEVSNA